MECSHISSHSYKYFQFCKTKKNEKIGSLEEYVEFRSSAKKIFETLDTLKHKILKRWKI